MATPAILRENRTSPSATAGPPRPPRLWIHLLLLALTMFTTTAVGMRYMMNFQAGQFALASDADVFPFAWVAANLRHLALGLPFSMTLLAILLVHEFGHYYACRAYGIRATLPYVLPAPSLSGTAGAVIRLLSRVKSRAALLAIGALGPLCGFVVATVMACVGLALSKPVAAEPARIVIFNSPLLIRLIEHLLGNALRLPLEGPLLWHPIFVASWIGLLITSLNLVPAGQLDGGHILYSYAPRLHRFVTYVAMAVLVYLGIRYWIGWLLWVGLLLLPGMRHPKVQDETPLSPALLILGPACLVIFILTITPAPFANASGIKTSARMVHALTRVAHGGHL